ncbi:MAG: hypothetical protein V6Z82_04195 [Flavobacteriales bacterium]
MKVDKFTKVVLTAIAANLMLLTIRNLNLLPKVYANELTNRVELNPDMKYGLVPLNDDGYINVKLSGANEINVNLVGIETNDELDVNIDEVGGGYVSYGGPIPVKVEQ